MKPAVKQDMIHMIRRVCKILSVDFELILIGSRRARVRRCRVIAFYYLWTKYTIIEIPDHISEIPGFSYENLNHGSRRVVGLCTTDEFKANLKLVAKKLKINQFVVKNVKSGGSAPHDYIHEINELL